MFYFCLFEKLITRTEPLFSYLDEVSLPQRQSWVLLGMMQTLHTRLEDFLSLLHSSFADPSKPAGDFCGAPETTDYRRCGGYKFHQWHWQFCLFPATPKIHICTAFYKLTACQCTCSSTGQKKRGLWYYISLQTWPCKGKRLGRPTIFHLGVWFPVI